MKKVIAVLLVAVLALGVLTACGKKDTTTTGGETTAAASDKESQTVQVEYAAQKVAASIVLPTLGGIETETEEYEGEGNTYTKVYSKENDATFADVDLSMCIVTQEYKDKTLAGERNTGDKETPELLKINGNEGCKYTYEEDAGRSVEYIVYADKNGDLVELSIHVQDSFSDLTQEEWDALCKAVETTVEFKL
ncbi:MAG: hypothetical protein IJG23_05705 [Clostridia bacterium]|nr:hypothetical protein [Clostridia bacterium]